LGWAVRALKYIVLSCKRFSPPGGFIILNHSVRTNELCHVKEDNLVRITKKNIENNALRGEKIRMKIFFIASEVGKRSIPFTIKAY
jgi:hypothetical protein